MATTTSTTSSVESTNWLGAIPVVLSLAPTSLSSPTLPPPLHKMVSRQSYLHSALEKEVRRLYKFAPMILSLPSVVRTEPVPEDTSLEEDNDEGKEEKEQKRQQQKDDNDENTHKYPVCWFEDEETGMPLRWHLFVGVLYDLTSRGDGSRSIPWKLRLHFNNYPSSQILPLEDDVVLKLVERTYKNSLKQALFLQNGSSKVAMNLSKQSHQKIWDSILTSKHQLYQQVNNDLLNTPNNVPVRILVDDQPAIQRPCGSAGETEWSILHIRYVLTPCCCCGCCSRCRVANGRVVVGGLGTPMVPFG